MRNHRYAKSSMARVLILGLLLLTFAFIFGISCQAYQPAPAPEPTPGPTPAPAPTPAPPPAPPTPGIAESGKAIFTSKACTGCHTIQGIPEAQGKVGPELTHWAGNSLIADTIPNTDENLRKWLKDPPVVKPGTLMPNQNLTDSEIDALIAFLRTLK